MPDISGKYVVDTSWLAANLATPGLVVLDGSWHLPAEKRDPKAEFAAGHIPSARFFDIDEISDKSSPLPHMLPAAERFAAGVEALCIGDGDCVVVYDASAPGLMSAGRVWWLLRIFGHSNVAVLDGGLRKWKAEGRPLEANAAPSPAPRKFTPRFDRSMVRDLGDMRSVVGADDAQIADARGAGRFEGRDPEPRPGLIAGHMPGARNVPFGTLLNGDGTLKTPAELRKVFESAGIDVARPVVTTCGSGVSAAVLTLALAVIGRDDTGLYDGSWSEWGQEKLGLPIAKGP